MKALTLEILMSIHHSSLFLSNPHILWTTTAFPISVTSGFCAVSL